MRHFFLTTIFLVLHFMAGAQVRPVMWIAGGLSANWADAVDNTEQKYKVITAGPGNIYLTTGLTAGIQAAAAGVNSDISGLGLSNVLGIGHDLGGITLRQMAKAGTNTPLTAMILAGAPNQGSRALNAMLPTPLSGPSIFKQLLDKYKAMRETVNNIESGCKGCEVLEATERLIALVSDSPNPHRDVAKGQNGNTFYTTIGEPVIPTAVIIGNATSQGLLDLLGSVGGGFNQNITRSCYEFEINQRKQEIKDKFNDELITNITSFTTDVIKTVKVDKLNVDVLQTVSDIVKKVFDTIKTIREKDQSLYRLLVCELIHQGLDAEWRLMVGGVQRAQADIAVPNDCLSFCINEPDPQAQADCYQHYYEEGCQPPVFNLRAYYYNYTASDLIYTTYEQSLTGSKVLSQYEVAETNHFQEQDWWKTGQHLEDLYDGSAGVAFKLTKK